jgi:hypothetical protein
MLLFVFKYTQEEYHTCTSCTIHSTTLQFKRDRPINYWASPWNIHHISRPSTVSPLFVTK